MESSERNVGLELVESAILVVRGKKVIIDADLARLYGVATKVLNQAVHRNRERFPQDFLFPLTAEEKEEVVTNCDHLRNIKFSKVLPNAFTEFGAIMAANVLNSDKAVRASVFVVRAFLRKTFRADLPPTWSPSAFARCASFGAIADRRTWMIDNQRSNITP